MSQSSRPSARQQGDFLSNRAIPAVSAGPEVPVYEGRPLVSLCPLDPANGMILAWANGLSALLAPLSPEPFAVPLPAGAPHEP